MCHLVTVTPSSLQAGLVGGACWRPSVHGLGTGSYSQHCRQSLLFARFGLKCSYTFSWLRDNGEVLIGSGRVSAGFSLWVLRLWSSFRKTATGPVLVWLSKFSSWMHSGSQLCWAHSQVALPTGPQTAERRGLLASWLIIKGSATVFLEWDLVCVCISHPLPFLLRFLISNIPTLEAVINTFLLP